MKTRLGGRTWAALLAFGLFGQIAWVIENMYFNVFLYNTISTDPGYISAMVGWSAAAATLTTLLMGALSDRVGKRKLFICGGYINAGGTVIAPTRDGLRHVEFSLRGTETYVRIECVDHAGKIAWTNAHFLEDEQK